MELKRVGPFPGTARRFARMRLSITFQIEHMKLPGDRQASSANPAATLAVRCATFAAAVLSLGGAALLVGVPSSAEAQHAPAYRDDTPAVDSAIAARNWAQALTELDQRIASNPRDVQARFKRATVLARIGRDDDAMQAFTQIIQSSPELPEPYNNLAALYAKHGRYQDARATLETALAANPTFALARRNLGDVYLRLAAQTYQEAAKDDPSDRIAGARQKAIEAIVANQPASAAYAKPSRAAAPAAPLHTTAEAPNARGFVPSMGAQPPTILPGSTDNVISPRD